MAPRKISDYMDVRLDAGYTDYTPDNTATNLVTSDTSGYYFSLSLSHRVNRLLSYTLSAGRRTDLAAYGQPQSYYFVRFDPDLDDCSKNTASARRSRGRRHPDLQHHGRAATDYQQIGLGASVSRALTQKAFGVRRLHICPGNLQPVPLSTGLDYTR